MRAPIPSAFSSSPDVTVTAPPAAGSSSDTEHAALRAKIALRAEQITSQDYFQMLGLDRESPPEAAQKAFISLAKSWHPDRLPAALADVKDACSKVFSHLTEAHATLTDAEKRQDYMTLLKDGGATPDDQAKIQAILEAATEFQKAEILLKRNLSDPQAYELLKRCVTRDPGRAEYVATLAWVEAQRPEWQPKEKTLEKIQLLDRCIQRNEQLERAYFYRAMLHKRIDDPTKALRDFKRASELNPRNVDAAREVRLYKMRGHGGSIPPAAPQPSPGGKPSNKPPAPTTGGGLLGKLFKKS
jgi:tetratricopeptide (TPR) repeat protein